ncbi:unnamed protein product [Ascophyllum nodosum]
MCAYHAWRFDADGKCLNIPQSESGGRDEAQPKACAKVYPTQVAQDIIWVWGENGPDAALESAMSSPALHKVAPGKKVLKNAVTQRDLPYGWDTFMENVMDPTHVEVSHHGLMGNRYKAKPKPAELVDGILSEVRYGDTYRQPIKCFLCASSDTSSFTPPALIGAEKPEDCTFQLVVYNIPTRPGWSRMITYQVLRFVSLLMRRRVSSFRTSVTSSGGKPGTRRSFFKIQPRDMPDWFQHVLGHKFIAQDLVFLHHQASRRLQTLAASGIDNRNYGKAVYTPTASDTGVINVRKWMANVAGGGPAWVTGCDRTVPPKEWKREVLLDVYEQHTKTCTACLGALKRVKQLLTAAKTSVVISLVWAVLRAARVSSTSNLTSALARNGVTLRAMFPGLAMTFASLAAIKGLETLHEAFYTSPYHHQDND